MVVCYDQGVRVRERLHRLLKNVDSKWYLLTGITHYLPLRHWAGHGLKCSANLAG